MADSIVVAVTETEVIAVTVNIGPPGSGGGGSGVTLPIAESDVTGLVSDLADLAQADTDEATTRSVAIDAEQTARAAADTALDGRTTALEATAPTAGQKSALAGTSGTPGSGNKYVTDGDSRLADSRAPSGSAGGQLGGTYPNPDVRGLRTTTGPTLLTLGAVADGDSLTRSGTSVIGVTKADQTHLDALSSHVDDVEAASIDADAVLDGRVDALEALDPLENGDAAGGDLTGTYPNPTLASANLQALIGLVGASDKAAYFTGSGALSLYTLTAFGRTLAGLADAAALRTAAGLVIGTDVQAYHANLAAFAGLTLVADRLPYANGSGTLALATFTAAGRALIDDADAAAQRTTLGLGTLAVLSAIAASDITSGTLALARGGTNADLSASGGATKILAQAADHSISARDLIAADIPSLAASKITSGTVDTARLGSGSASSSTFLRGDQTWATPAGGGYTVQSKTSGYTAAVGEFVVCDATSAAFTVALPAASGNSGKQIGVKKTDASAHAVTVDGNSSETIDGQLTYLLAIQYEAVTLICDGSNWYIL